MCDIGLLRSLFPQSTGNKVRETALAHATSNEFDI